MSAKSVVFVLLTLATVSVMAYERPIIGILSQEVSDLVNSKYNNEYHSIIPASYVKFVEGAGARVVPIRIGQRKSYYTNIMSKINGVLFPGGVASFRNRDGYADAAHHIIQIAKEMNDYGTHFPILGICLGFEVVMYVISGHKQSILTDCSAENIKLPLTFTTDYKDGRMFKGAPNDLIDMLKHQDLTFNVHQKCVTTTELHNKRIRDQFRVLSTNRDQTGLRFISSFEMIDYPIYGLQFHPEKNLYEWKKGRNIPHGKNATRVGQYFANFFVSEARKNDNSFEDDVEEADNLIYNYHAEYTAQRGLVFQQSYLFKSG
ncbi:gamma-glutamyl hydrolase-like isoform X2 [Augochlora pura]